LLESFLPGGKIFGTWPWLGGLLLDLIRPFL
jgi:hypothetical protein